MERGMVRSVVALFVGLLAAGVSGCAAPGGRGEEFQFTRVTMGVATRITVEAPDRETALQGAAAAFDRIEEIEQAASDYRPGSEVMRLCREARVGEWRAVGPDLAALLRVSEEVSERTAGAFDVTVGPLVALWREARKTAQLPDPNMLSAAKSRVGWRGVEVDGEYGVPHVRLSVADMRLDFGGVAKGYAAREAGRVLENLRLPRCLVALAGDVYAGEAPTGRDGWRVEVRGDGARVVGVLIVSQASVSTSGDAEQFVEIDGVRYSHIVDPRSGLGVVGGVAVTAIGEDGGYVDAADTGAAVLGVDGMRKAFAGDRKVTLIVHRGDGAPEVIGDPSRVKWAK
jgi:thiamine biosynthesis lipoprotein